MQPRKNLADCAARMNSIADNESDPALTDDIPTLRRILKQNHTIAIVGLSRNWYRPSYFAAKYLIDHGYRVIPVNPGVDEVLGMICYPSLEAIPEPVDIVDCFRVASAIPKLARSAVAIGAKVLWLQLGIIHHEAAATATAAGLEVIMDRCIKIEYARLFGGLNYCGVNTGVISAKRPLDMIH